ncbi:heme acquisition protein HasA [Yersinia aldovae]|uniref:heme acquisition protein HasA n=1 Tax=Yersinia aldovae TaxID=29483 RepID=UPI00119E4011|nr:heme acquisition protein HasA [Yersinia aldovae]
MIVTIKYQEKFKDETISSYAQQWATDFGDIVQQSCECQYDIYSAGPNYPNAGVKLAIQKNSHSQIQSSKAAIVMESKGIKSAEIMKSKGIDVFEDSPLIPGNEGLEFGDSLIAISDVGIADPESHQLQLQNVQLKFSGIDISNDIDVSSIEIFYAMLMDDNHQGSPNLSIYNLLRGNALPLLEVLKSQGVDVNTPLKDMVIASQFDVIADAPIIDILGSTVGNEILLGV